MAGLFLIALFGGLIFGHGQILVESWRGTWSYLLHRNTGASKLLWAKRWAAFAAGLVCTLLPAWTAYGLALFNEEAVFHWHRPVELAAIALWFVPAYAVGQWQALSDSGRKAEWMLRIPISIALAGAPFALLKEFDLAHLPPPSGFLLLLLIEGAMAWGAFSLASRRLARRPAADRVLPRGELIGTAIIAVLAIGSLVTLTTHELRRGVVRRVTSSFGRVLADDAGRFATWRTAKDGYQLVATDGEVVAEHRSPGVWFPEGWEVIQPSADVLRDRELMRGRRVPFVLSNWIEIGRGWAERSQPRERPEVHHAYLIPETGRLLLTGRLPSGRRWREVVDSSGNPLRLGPETVATSVGLDSQRSRDTSGIGFLVMEPGNETMYLVEPGQPATVVTLADRDVPRHFRRDRTILRNGYSDNTQTVLVGDAGEYRWDPESLSFESWIDPSPIRWMLEVSDPLERPARVAPSGETIDREWLSPRPHSVELASISLGTWLRPPIFSVASVLVPAPRDPHEHVAWTHVFDWTLANGRRSNVLYVHIGIGVLSALLVAWFARRRSWRAFWIGLCALFGPVGILWFFVETKDRKDRTQPRVA